MHCEPQSAIVCGHGRGGQECGGRGLPGAQAERPAGRVTPSQNKQEAWEAVTPLRHRASSVPCLLCGSRQASKYPPKMGQGQELHRKRYKVGAETDHLLKKLQRALKLLLFKPLASRISHRCFVPQSPRRCSVQSTDQLHRRGRASRSACVEGLVCLSRARREAPGRVCQGVSRLGWGFRAGKCFFPVWGSWQRGPRMK